MVFYLLLFWTLLVSSFGHAGGGTMVGNGGGYAEMQAVYLDQSLTEYLRPFSEYDVFARALDSRAKPPLQFQSDCVFPSPDSVTAGKVVLSSCLLYGEDLGPLGPEPLSLAEIGANLFAVRWMSVFGRGEYQALRQQGLELFSSVQLRTKRIPLVWSSRTVGQLHIWSVSVEGKAFSESQLSLETPRQTLEILPLLKGHVACNAEMEVAVNYVQMQYYRPADTQGKGIRFQFYGPLSWSCGKESHSGKWAIKVREEPEGGEILVDLSVFGRQPLMD